jgi:hypothetical protein
VADGAPPPANGGDPLQGQGEGEGEGQGEKSRCGGFGPPRLALLARLKVRLH